MGGAGSGGFGLDADEWEEWLAMSSASASSAAAAADDGGNATLSRRPRPATVKNVHLPSRLAKAVCTRFRVRPGRLVDNECATLQQTIDVPFPTVSECLEELEEQGKFIGVHSARLAVADAGAMECGSAAAAEDNKRVNRAGVSASSWETAPASKSRLCRSVGSGEPCRHGEKCRYPHTVRELPRACYDELLRLF